MSGVPTDVTSAAMTAMKEQNRSAVRFTFTHAHYDEILILYIFYSLEANAFRVLFSVPASNDFFSII